MRMGHSGFAFWVFAGLLAAGSVGGACGVGGCAGNRRAGSSSGTFFQNPFRSNRVYWTILCMEFRGPGRQSRCEKVASTLKKTPGIKPRDVFIRDEPRRTRLYHGKYRREADPETGWLKTTPEMVHDAKMIKDLTVDGSRYFLDSRLMPYPTPDVGNPAWRLKNNHGLYTLRVALFFPEPGFSDWKKASAAYCAELRRQGFEAYCRHGDYTSEVYVGSFGEEALVQTRKSGVEFAIPSQMILDLQKNELLRYELQNMKTRSRHGNDKRYVRASRVVPVKTPWDEEDVADECMGFGP